MAMRITFELRVFDDVDVQHQVITMRALLEALVAANTKYLVERGSKMKSFDYWTKEGGVHYREHKSELLWLDIPSIIAHGFGDAKDLACWRVAELRLKGEDDVHPFIKVSRDEKTDATIWRVGVRHKDKIEWFDDAAR